MKIDKELKIEYKDRNSVFYENRINEQFCYMSYFFMIPFLRKWLFIAINLST